MRKNDLKIWENLSFKTTSYRKNSDFIIRDENIVTEIEGDISMLRFGEGKLPVLIGEYYLSSWNLALANIFDTDISEILTSFAVDDPYKELNNAYNQGDIDLSDVDRLVFIESLVIHPNFRKHGVSDEFFEVMYREYYMKNTLILGFFKPFQENLLDETHYLFEKSVEFREQYTDEPQKIPARKYYGLDNLIENYDSEGTGYKLFSLAKRCGFERIGDSHLFILDPQTIIERLLKKRNKTKNNNLKNQLKK